MKTKYMSVNPVANTPEIETALQDRGFWLFPSIIPCDLLDRIRVDLMMVYAKRRRTQRRNGVADDMLGACHHALGDNNSMDELIAHFPLHDAIHAYFNGPYILNSFGGFINYPSHQSYVHRIHRDVRTHAGDFRLLLNVLIPLDDFTEDNGATYFLPGSHKFDDKPADAAFFATSERLRARAGDIFMFDSNMWHAAGENRTDTVRRGLTLTFSRPFFKQQLDLPRYLGRKYASNLSPHARQILGYNAQTPATISEFYQPADKRAYKPGQE
jgi:hypothetical protein